ncbi:MAG: TVP38/TMEM64 family protein [Ectothiorhodospira sp.]
MPPTASLLRRSLLAVSLMAIAGTLWVVLGDRALDWIGRHQATVLQLAREETALAGLGYVAAVTLGKITPFPGGFLLMLTGGYLFGAPLGAVLCALGSGLSAVLVAALGRRLFPYWIHRRWGHRLVGFEKGLARNGFHLLLALRLFPVVPAWLANLLPVAFPIPLGQVLAATTLGLLPISFLVGRLGAGLADLTQARHLEPADVLTPDLLLPLAGLAVMALIPVFLRQRRHRRD